jgi:multiple sugar transport system permease protein
MRNSFEGIPKEIEEASVVDGASSFFAFRRIFLPLVLPGMVTVALFAFIASWNEFIGALIIMNSEAAFTVPIMMTGVMTGNFGSVNWGALQASVIVSILPCMIVYLLLQRYYISGLLSGAVK